MKKGAKMRVLSVVLLCCVMCLSEVSGLTDEDKEYQEGFALTTAVERSDLIVVGSVTEKEFVWRDNIESGPTTDITVAVDEIIKGTPNAGKNTVKFMIQGGEGVNPHTGEHRNLWVSHQVECEIGEKALFFFYYAEDHISYYKDYPHDGVQVYYGEYGKRLIRNNTVWFYLLDIKELKDVALSVDLAVLLCKATIIDKEAAVMLENEIKAVIRQSDQDSVKLSQSLVDRLKHKSKKIVEGYEDGVEIACDLARLGSGDISVDVHFPRDAIHGRSDGYAKGFCRGFIGTMKRHFRYDYDCICGYHLPYNK